jgi:dienelactone hydrolase
MPIKWVDNVLYHNKIGGIRQERQGIARRLSVEGLLVLALTALLVHELGVSTTRAITIAEGIIDGDGRQMRSEGLSVEINLPTFQARLLESLENAVEVAPVPRRGRPPAKKTGRLD